MIAVSFALPAESSEFIRQLQDRSRIGGASQIVSGTLHGKNVVIFHTGVGAVMAQKRIADFLETHSPEVLISAGFAGALTNELKVGDLFLAENFPPARLFAAALLALSGKVMTGKLVTVSTVADSAAERAALARESDALAVDMETKSIAEACARRNVPMLSLRIITDSPLAPFGIPAEVLFDLGRQRTSIARLTMHLLRHPGAVGKLISIARRVSTARRSLASALHLFFRSEFLRAL